MKHILLKRVLPILLVALLIAGLIPFSFAADSEESAVEESAVEIVEEPHILPPEQSEGSSTEPKEPSEATDAPVSPLSDDGAELTRDEALFATSATSGARRARRLAAAGGTGTMTKEDCVDFAEYTSPDWYCNRYYQEGSHIYGHYFHTWTIVYHKTPSISSFLLGTPVPRVSPSPAYPTRKT